MTLLQTILHWSKSLSSWQRTALKLLVEKGSLSNEDLDQLTLQCKDRNSFQIDKTLLLPFQPLSEVDLPVDEDSDAAVKLLEINNIKSVNALADGQIISFSPQGITVIYGDNGSGKSGYAKILKNCCRARSRGGIILPNIYKPRPVHPASAKIMFQKGNSKHIVDWEDGSPSNPELSKVSFFDSECGSVYLDEENDVAFIPYGLDLLHKLVLTCKEVQNKFREEKRNVENKINPIIVQPQIDTSTAVGQMLSNITASSSVDEFEKVSILSEDEEKRIRILQSILSQDPIQITRQLRNRSGRIKRMKDILVKTQNALSDEKKEELKTSFLDVKKKSHTADIVANEMFSNQPLKNVGSDTWRRLWEAAKRYSESDAYPGKTFPVTEMDARCVLCQQELDIETIERFNKFEEFVTRDVKHQAENARDKFQQELLGLNTLTISTTENKDAIVEIDVENSQFKNEIRRFFVKAQLRRRAILRCVNDDDWKSIPDLYNVSIETIDNLIKQLETQADQAEKSTKPEERKRLEKELHELEARQWLSKNLRGVGNEIDRLKFLKKYDDCTSDADTTMITRKSSELTDQYVTKSLMKKFNEELKGLGIDTIFTELSSAGGHYGAKKFRIRIKGVTPDIKMTQVASEGEKTCIALSGFLTELATASHNSTLIFDDPVSSLDHQ